MQNFDLGKKNGGDTKFAPAIRKGKLIADTTRNH